MKFSIVIPTRNRSRFLRYAIASALSQDWDDYEVLVSNNASSDATRAVVCEFQGPHLEYVETESCLSMVDHWEWAIRKAVGDWILVLCDDDALVPSCLRRIADYGRAERATDIIQYQAAPYYYAEGPEGYGNSLELRQVRGCGPALNNSAEQLRRVFWGLRDDMPKFLNCAVRRRLLDEIRGRFSRLFRPWAPDYSGGALLLATTRRYMAVPDVCLIWGCGGQSYGVGTLDDPDQLLGFFREFPEFDGTMALSPYPKLLSVGNGVYDTLVRVRQLLGWRAARLPVNPITYRERILVDILRYVRAGHAEYRLWGKQVRADLRLRGYALYQLGRRARQMLRAVRRAAEPGTSKPRTRKAEMVACRDIAVAARAWDNRTGGIAAARSSETAT